MFTGLVETRGRLLALRRSGDGARLRVSAPFAGELERGDSVAVNGICLTVVALFEGGFEADAVERTLSLTTLGSLPRGSEVNLERALSLGDRLGGHMVTGHIDGVAAVAAVRPGAPGRDVVFELPRDLMRHVAEKGSIAIDGISLTVASVQATRVTVSLIPETLAATVAGGYRPGLRVNVETDVAAKYQEALLRDRGGDGAEADDHDGGRRDAGITLERLRELGF